MSNKRIKYPVQQSKVKKLVASCDWLLLLGARANGKSYSAKNFIIKECIDKGKEFIYLRRYDLDIKDSVCVSYFGDCPVETMTNGEYSCIDVYRKGIYLANIDPDTHKIIRGEKIGYCHALSGAEHYKSLAFPNVEFIDFEEFVSFDGRYLFNELSKLQQYASSIFRNRKGKILMIGNTISRLCPYYRELNLDIEGAPLGTIKHYIYHNDNGEDTKLTAWLTEPLNYNSGMFFGLSSNNITKGAYEVQEQPHLPKSIVKYKVLYTLVMEYNNFKFLCQLLQDKDECNNVCWYVQPKTSEIKEGTRVISNKFSPDPLYTTNFRQAINENEARVLRMFNDDKVCFSDNLTGTEFKNILKNLM